MKRSLTYISILLLAVSARATHIVGGDMTYQHVSQNQYRVTLHLYIDCELGDPSAISADNQANISYFDVDTDSLIDNDPLNFLNKVNVEQLNYKCLKAEPNACVQQFTFSYLKEIDPGTNGVIIAFQRCCRNRSITNIINPEDVGATFFTVVPPVQVVEHNSSAVFTNLPPNFLCTNAPLVFDHSATDADGDSLVYSISLPYIGADPINNRPVPANNPPYRSVSMSGSYNELNMMDGTVLLQIDAKTGLLRVTPSRVGQFVVAVRVDEYRDGVKINEGFRDYQLNVIDCVVDVIANFKSPGVTCDKDLFFPNQSLGESLSYQWDFGEETTTKDVSSAKDGAWIYSDIGTYTVKLIVSTSSCTDTFAQDVTIIPSRFIYAKYDVSPRVGCDSLTVSISNSSDSVTLYKWDMGDGSQQIVNQDIAQYTYRTPGIYTITLDLVDSNTCNITDDSSVVVQVLETQRLEAYFAVEYKKECESDGIVKLKNIINDAFTYEWVWSDGTVWRSSTEEQHHFRTKGYHTVTLYTKDTGRCTINDTAEVEVYIASITPLLDDIKLYNAFTPGDDSYNNCFTVDLGNLECISVSFSIYNRWGERVFESDEANNCWDGKNYRTNKDLPEGEYFGVYKFTLEGDEEDYTLSNVINLLRN